MRAEEDEEAEEVIEEAPDPETSRRIEEAAAIAHDVND
jgi:hypothetical protein